MQLGQPPQIPARPDLDHPPEGPEGPTGSHPRDEELPVAGLRGAASEAPAHALGTGPPGSLEPDGISRQLSSRPLRSRARRSVGSEHGFSFAGASCPSQAFAPSSRLRFSAPLGHLGGAGDLISMWVPDLSCRGD